DPGSSRITSPPARFLQYRALLKRGTGSSSPEVRQLGVAYMAKNVPPVIQEIDITPPNYKFSPVTSLASTPGSTLTLPPLGRTASGASAPAPSITPLGGLEGLGSSSSQSMQAARGFGGARWAVTDPNGDEMKFKLEIKGVAETTWKLLKENVKEKYLSWDSSAFADGIYVLRLTATDAPANPTELALTTQLESDRFLIDNTAPRISALAGARAGNKLNVQWKAVDTSTHVQKAQYSLDGGEWLTVLPTTKLSDAPELAYYLELEGRPGEHTIAVRVADEYENEAVDKIVIQ
ncbi:MAG TPA: hypothetical protein VEQ63_03870, partial [Bryobacteraceae bacterium]|nr:hypothetical protein [Bryobacteraceae bacterium]